MTYIALVVALLLVARLVVIIHRQTKDRGRYWYR